MRSITIHSEITDEGKTRAVPEGKLYSLLTAEIARGIFGEMPRAQDRL